MRNGKTLPLKMGWSREIGDRRLFISKNATYPLKVQSILVMPSELEEKRVLEPHPSWMGQSTKIVTREVVYYILSGTPRAPQKCFWSNLRVEFLGENHLFLICEKMPNQTLQLIKYLDSGWNSDLFEKKNCWNPSTNCKVRAVQKWLPFSKNVQKLLSVTVQTCPIWILFFFK